MAKVFWTIAAVLVALGLFGSTLEDDPPADGTDTRATEKPAAQPKSAPKAKTTAFKDGPLTPAALEKQVLNIWDGGDVFNPWIGATCRGDVCTVTLKADDALGSNCPFDPAAGVAAEYFTAFFKHPRLATARLRYVHTVESKDVYGITSKRQRPLLDIDMTRTEWRKVNVEEFYFRDLPKIALRYSEHACKD